MPQQHVEALAARVSERPEMYRADRLADRLGVTDAQRTALGLKTIGATDVRKEAREIRRKEKKKQYARLRRVREAEKQGRTLRPRPGRPPKNSCPISPVIDAVHEFSGAECVGPSVGPSQGMELERPPAQDRALRTNLDALTPSRCGPGSAPGTPPIEVLFEARALAEKMSKRLGFWDGLTPDEIDRVLRTAWNANPHGWEAQFLKDVEKQYGRKAVRRVKKARDWSRNQFKQGRMPGLGPVVMLEAYKKARATRA